jgi:hypothetical protein
MEDSLIKKLNELKPEKQGIRINHVIPTIEKKLKEGVSLSRIVEVLKEEGIQLTESTLKTYLYRYRKKKTSPEKESFSSTDSTENDSSISPQELNKLIRPDPKKQEEDIAKYEHIMREKRRSRSK